METRRIISLVTAAVLVLLCVSCSDDTDGQSWQFDEPPPESTVNQALCGDMPGSEIDGPVVAQVDEEQWRVRYPVFEQGCGVYQLDAYIGPSHDGDLGAEYETRVCNRCDQPQKLVFLDDYGAIGVEGPTEPLPTPQQPDVRDDVPTLFFQGLPPVRAGASDESCRMISTSGETTGYHSFPSYGGFYRVSLAAGESTELHRS